MNKISQILKKVKEKSPLICHITNYVTAYDCANIVKVLGACAVMSDAKQEIKEMVLLSNALLVNIGTVNMQTFKAMKIAIKTANEKNIPVILDIVGCGATKFRNQIAKKLLKNKISVIKGNASEVASLYGLNVQTKGVDSTNVNADMSKIAKELAVKYNCVVVITGKTDICTNGNKIVSVKNGTPLMSKIVGTGCMAGSIIATFCSVQKDFLLASVLGLKCFELAAEKAQRQCKGLGTFKVKLFDIVARGNI